MLQRTANVSDSNFECSVAVQVAREATFECRPDVDADRSFPASPRVRIENERFGLAASTRCSIYFRHVS